MKKQDIITSISESSKINKKKTKEILDLTFDFIKNELKSGEKVKISGFGAFEIMIRKSTRGINPKTKEVIEIPATKVIKFKPTQPLKEEIKKS